MLVYLAGPDVFHPAAVALGTRKKALCAERGFTGLYPLDQDVSASLVTSGAAIYENCRAMMAAADLGIFNLTPFRGPSADVGTVLELGVMAGQGKPVFAYTNVADDLIGRLRSAGDLRRDATGMWRDADGLMAEDFGNADNLMLDETLAAQGRRIHRHAAAAAELFTDFSGFVACLEEAARARTECGPNAGFEVGKS